MSGTTTISPINANDVIWAFDLVSEWGGPSGVFFVVIPDGEHILVADGVSCYRLPADTFHHFSTLMSADAAQLFATSATGVSSTEMPFGETIRDGLLSIMSAADRTEECALLPIGFARGYGDALTTFCVSDSGRVEIVQTRYLDPVKALTGVTFWFGDASPTIYAMQGDLCIAAIQPLGAHSTDEAQRERDLAARIARAAYAICQNSEARS